ncbi:hypothetical protein BH10BDE1_BH10BDE1_22380 [soil metagenome]
MKAVPWIVMVAILVIAIGYFGHGYLISRDFRRMCEIHHEFLKDAAAKGPAQTAYEIANRIDKSMLTSVARNTYRVVGLVAANEKYLLIKQGALEAGVSDWSCPEMEAYMKPEPQESATSGK